MKTATEASGDKAKAKSTGGMIEIRAPNYAVVSFNIIGTSPFVSNKFADEARDQMRAQMAAGSSSKLKKRGGERAGKDFDASYHGSMHKSDDGWYGIPSTAFKAAMVRAASQVGVSMIMLKQVLFIEADGFGDKGVTPLIRFTKGVPAPFDAYVKLKNGSTDIKRRGRWEPGWTCELRVRYDADLMTPTTIANLVLRAGLSVGVGAGRPCSTTSVGMGWGTFTIAE